MTTFKQLHRCTAPISTPVTVFGDLRSRLLRPEYFIKPRPWLSNFLPTLWYILMLPGRWSIKVTLALFLVKLIPGYSSFLPTLWHILILLEQWSIRVTEAWLLVKLNPGHNLLAYYLQYIMTYFDIARTMERGRLKCGQYWPVEEDSEHNCDEFLIINTGIEQHQDYTVTGLLLHNTKVCMRRGNL